MTPPTFSSILYYSVSDTLMASKIKIASTISPSHSPNNFLSRTIEIHLVFQVNIVGIRDDLNGLMN